MNAFSFFLRHGIRKKIAFQGQKSRFQGVNRYVFSFMLDIIIFTWDVIPNHMGHILNYMERILNYLGRIRKEQANISIYGFSHLDFRGIVMFFSLN